MNYYRLHIRSPYPGEETVRYYRVIQAWSHKEAARVARKKYSDRLLLVERWNRNRAAGRGDFEIC